ncbi:Extensin like [Actinidia chinensis var. chinensis]|uniref:Extensin like n=1 Tax=Actinidia chinensis var. chinensis TaxID=1590841 RepID=A0A2R6Q877_ACTCC|nr:Extensin like [Actinidia chinensis var. chinensis]
MTSLLPINGGRGQITPAASRSPPRPKLMRRRGDLITVPRKLRLFREIKGARRLTKLVLNVNIQGSGGLVQVVMSPENSVGDLIKAALETYVKEIRRPLLKETDPRWFELHYSQLNLAMGIAFV